MYPINSESTPSVPPTLILLHRIMNISLNVDVLLCISKVWATVSNRVWSLHTESIGFNTWHIQLIHSSYWERSFSAFSQSKIYWPRKNTSQRILVRGNGLLKGQIFLRGGGTQLKIQSPDSEKIRFQLLGYFHTTFQQAGCTVCSLKSR